MKSEGAVGDPLNISCMQCPGEEEKKFEVPPGGTTPTGTTPPGGTTPTERAGGDVPGTEPGPSKENTPSDTGPSGGLPRVDAGAPAEIVTTRTPAPELAANVSDSDFPSEIFAEESSNPAHGSEKSDCGFKSPTSLSDALHAATDALLDQS